MEQAAAAALQAAPLAVQPWCDAHCLALEDAVQQLFFQTVVLMLAVRVAARNGIFEAIRSASAASASSAQSVRAAIAADRQAAEAASSTAKEAAAQAQAALQAIKDLKSNPKADQVKGVLGGGGRGPPGWLPAHGPVLLPSTAHLPEASTLMRKRKSHSELGCSQSGPS